MHKINRVKSLQIDNFRGIKKLQQPLNTDADVVLITGPNGFGKTSLVDALNILLNGYYYSERKPLLCIYGDEKDLEAKITAKVLYDDGNEEDICVRVNDKDILELTAAGYEWSAEAHREIVARASFFYQDLINRLFDEEGAEKTLKEFLAPSPARVRESVKAINSVKKYLDGKEKGVFNLPGVISQEQLDRQRQEVVRDFIQNWNELALYQDLPGGSIPRLEGALWFEDSGMLRDNWTSLLAELVNSIRSLRAEKLDEVSTDNEAIPTLQQLMTLLQHLRDQIIANNQRDRFSAFVHSLPDGAVLLPQERLLEERERLNRIQHSITNTKQKVEQLQLWERHFQNPDGPGLSEVLLALRNKGQEWLNVSDYMDSNYAPPVQVIKWLKVAVDSLFLDDKGVDYYMGSWQERIRQERMQLQELIRKQDYSYREGVKLLDLSNQIYQMAEMDPALRELINKLNIRGSQLSKENLMAELNEVNDSRHQPLQIIGAIINSIVRWIETEKAIISREKSLREARELEKAKNYLDGARKALEEESSKNSLINTVQSLPQRDMGHFVGMVNKIFSRFRIVPGLHPVQLRPGNRGARSSKVETWDIRMADGRPLSTLSSGQKAQLGLSLLLGLNVALDDLMPHHVLALDDTTTAFDMAQLPREASLLRQIVYGADGDDEREAAGRVSPRRQLFIVSHHEDLTHRLIDFLIPPENKNLHILNFKYWEQEKGPDIEQLVISPARSVNADSRREFGCFLDSILNTQ
ncbi:MAG: AAA family ATPase [Syntrophomonadaceae bacterium]|nr:AAA family ATPase [Syntrophomonadaceae bacterium]